MSENTKYVGFRVPRKMLEAFDEVIKDSYPHRSGALLAAMWDLIKKEKEQKRIREA